MKEDLMAKASRSEMGMSLNRRQALAVSATAGAGLAISKPAPAVDSAKIAARQNCSTPRTAVAKTQYGKVRGFLDGGVLTFKGVPYGQNTAGENRWLPAKTPFPWKDEYPALIYGPNCPQQLHDFTIIEQSFLLDWDDGYQSEDMLKLNIWTPSLTGSRAVMVYFHGGGFHFGSSYELPSYEGAQMARHQEVVQVSVNHRLNVLGFFDVSEVGGIPYEGSVNVGITDLVAALRWVQENIANFGGDPGRVMIYGQSGGAAKVTTLMGMPSAAGLFHRVSVQSGFISAIPTGEQQKEFARQVIKELGIAPNDIAALRKMEWSKLNRVGNAVADRMNPPVEGLTGWGSPPPPRVAQVGWSPTLDGHIINVRSFYDAAPEISKDVPMLTGSVSEEGNYMASCPTEAECHATLAKALGDDKATALIAAMKKAHPEKSIRTLSYGVAGLSNLNRAYDFTKMKYDQHAAPVYQYYFTWQTPMLEEAGAWHTSELAFCFDNTRRCEQATGNTPEAQALAKKMATAWANFARTGNPSQPGLAWPPADPEHNQTMVWDNECRMVNDPEGEARKILLS
jgi:para-nitrobenzyl esterase